MKLSDSRRAVAREAARLLYTGAFEEYKLAKEEAARRLNINTVPSNYDVALELDLIADEMEGEGHKNLLLKMRRAALRLMSTLKEFDPRLIGSVWRGTARKGSDIDIVAYASRSADVEGKLSAAGFTVKGAEETVSQDRGRLRRAEHIRVELEDDMEAEVVVRPQEEEDFVERCDVYGDLKSGLSLRELEKLMRSDPLRKFVPERKQR